MPASRDTSRLLKVARGIVTAVAIPLVFYSAWTHRVELSRGLRLLPRLSAAWLGIGIVAEFGSLCAYAFLQRGLLGEWKTGLTRTHALRLVLAGNALSNSLPGGVAWSSTWYWSELRRRSVSGSRAAWAIVASGTFSGVSLALLISAGAGLAGAGGPLGSLRWVGAAVALIAIGLVGFIAMGPSTWAGSGPGRRSGIREWLSFTGDLRGMRVARPLALSLANWSLDLVLLAACIRAVDTRVPLGGLVAAYGLTQLSLVVPITPGGLAIVEGTLVALLTAYGTPSATAVAAVLLYRAVSFWALTPLGWIAYVTLPGSVDPVRVAPVRTESGWTADGCNGPAEPCHSAA